jgi:hypothetical protein
VKWLPRDWINGPFMCLVTSPEEFARVMKKLGIKDTVAWKGATANATTTELVSDKGQHCCVVSLDIGACVDKSPIQIAALLVHEGVHVWQAYCRHIGEDSPSKEFEAYSIQAISGRLMKAYADKVPK